MLKSQSQILAPMQADSAPCKIPKNLGCMTAQPSKFHTNQFWGRLVTETIHLKGDNDHTFNQTANEVGVLSTLTLLATD